MSRCRSYLSHYCGVEVVVEYVIEGVAVGPPAVSHAAETCWRVRRAAGMGMVE